MNCRSCGTKLAAGATSCSKCGTAVEAEAAPVDHFESGTILKGTYKVLQSVGEGGAGVVYVAEHTSLGHLVAVKTLFGKLARHADMRARFLEEGIIQANLNHPNIVRVTDTINEAGVTAIVMEYIDGSSMDGYLRKLGKPLPVVDCVKLFLPVLDAMFFAHEQGVVHRDLKPGNILLANVGGGRQPKVTDFGIAKVLSNHSRTATGTTMGTLYYIAPEQLTNAKGVDHRADIYSLGCTLFELLTLRVPFEASSDYEIMRAHIEAPAPDPRVHRPEIPAALAEITVKSLNKRAIDRFATCKAFKEALIAALADPTLSLASPAVALPAVPRTATPIKDTSDVSGAHTSLATNLPAVSAPPQTPSGRHTPDARTGAEQRQPAGRTPVAVGASETSSPRGSGGTRLTGPSASGAAAAPRSERASGPQRSMGPSVTTARSTGPRAAPRTAIDVPAPRTAAAPAGVGMQKIVWGVIAALALGLTAVVSFSVSRGSNDAPPPSVSALPVLPLPAATPAAPAGSGAAPPTEVKLDVLQCRDLAQRWVDGTLPEGQPRDAAITDLETHEGECSALMLKHASGSVYDALAANLNGDQLRMFAGVLRAYRGRDAGSDPCTDVLIASTEAQRSLQRIREAVALEHLMDYEKASISPRRQRVIQFHNRLTTDFPQCPISRVSPELLMLTADAAPGSGAAPEGSAAPAPGSGWQQ